MGGFPCLGFTVAKGSSRNVNDKTNFLYKEFLRIVEQKQPKLFLIENVPGMKQGKKFSILFQQLLNEFQNAGYNVKYETLNAVNYGVPQFRKRIIIIGTRHDLDLHFNYCKPTHFEKEGNKDDEDKFVPFVTIRDAIGDLPAPGNGIIKNHVGTKHKVKINNYIGNRKLFWDKPSPTITGRGSLTGGPVIHPHPNLKRRLTVRECARLQSFPDDFEFEGSTSAGYAQVGNAVPPLFAFRLGQCVLKTFGETPNLFNCKEWLLPWVKKIPEN